MWRTQPLPPDWPQRRQRILERDGYRCRSILSDGTRCKGRATDVHHTASPDDHRDEVLESRCAWHHKRETSAQANRKRRRITTKRPAEKHPGLK